MNIKIASFDHDGIKDVNYGENLKRNVIVDYPLSKPAVRPIRFSTLYELIDEIRRVYIEIYDEEEKTTSTYQESATLLNRGRTNGVHGIWGHDIRDLWIEGIEIGDNEVKLWIGS